MHTGQWTGGLGAACQWMCGLGAVFCGSWATASVAVWPEEWWKGVPQARVLLPALSLSI